MHYGPDGLVDDWLLLKNGNSLISHTIRGCHNEREFIFFQQLNENHSQLQCRFVCRDCQFITTYNVNDFIKNKILTCPQCLSLNVTIDWMEFSTIMQQNFFITQDNITAIFQLYTSDPYYSGQYHRHYQREVIGT